MEISEEMKLAFLKPGQNSCPALGKCVLSKRQNVRYPDVKYSKIGHKPLKDIPLTISEFHKWIFGILSQRFHPIAGTAKVGSARIHNW